MVAKVKTAFLWAWHGVLLIGCLAGALIALDVAHHCWTTAGEVGGPAPVWRILAAGLLVLGGALAWESWCRWCTLRAIATERRGGPPVTGPTD